MCRASWGPPKNELDKTKEITADCISKTNEDIAKFQKDCAVLEKPVDEGKTQRSIFNKQHFTYIH